MFAMLPPLTIMPPHLRVADQPGDPSHRLRFDFRGGRRQRPGADIRVEGGREEVAEDADRRRRRRDVPEETWMRVEQRCSKSSAWCVRAAAPDPCRVREAAPTDRAPRGPPRAIRHESPDRAAAIRGLGELIHESMSERRKVAASIASGVCRADSSAITLLLRTFVGGTHCSGREPASPQSGSSSSIFVASTVFRGRRKIAG